MLAVESMFDFEEVDVDEVDVDAVSLESTSLDSQSSQESEVGLLPTLSSEDTTSILVHFNLIDSLLRSETHKNKQKNKNPTELSFSSSPRDVVSFPDEHLDDHSLVGEGLPLRDHDDERPTEPKLEECSAENGTEISNQNTDNNNQQQQQQQQQQVVFELDLGNNKSTCLICQSESCTSSITSCDRSSLESDSYYDDSSCSSGKERHRHHHDDYFLEDVAIEEPDKWQEV